MKHQDQTSWLQAMILINSPHLVWGSNCLNGVSPAEHEILLPSRENLGRAYKSFKIAVSLGTPSKYLHFVLENKTNTSRRPFKLIFRPSRLQKPVKIAFSLETSSKFSGLSQKCYPNIGRLYTKSVRKKTSKYLCMFVFFQKLRSPAEHPQIFSDFSFKIAPVRSVLNILMIYQKLLYRAEHSQSFVDFSFKIALLCGASSKF